MKSQQVLHEAARRSLWRKVCAGRGGSVSKANAALSEYDKKFPEAIHPGIIAPHVTEYSIESLNEALQGTGYELKKVGSNEKA